MPYLWRYVVMHAKKANTAYFAHFQNIHFLHDCDVNISLLGKTALHVDVLVIITNL